MPLTPAEVAVIAVSAAISSRSDDRIRAALAEAHRSADPVHVEEALLQCTLFMGYPAALNGFAAWREVSGRAAPDPAEPNLSQEDWAERGEAVLRRVYGGQVNRLRENVRTLHPEMERWMIAEGYGKVLGRPGMELALRELCIVAILVVQDAPRQLHSHLRGALNCGAGRERVDAAVGVAERYALPRAAERARIVWRSVANRRTD